MPVRPLNAISPKGGGVAKAFEKFSSARKSNTINSMRAKMWGGAPQISPTNANRTATAAIEQMVTIFAEDSCKINHFLSLGKHFIDIFTCSSDMSERLLTSKLYGNYWKWNVKKASIFFLSISHSLVPFCFLSTISIAVHSEFEG